MNSPRLLRECDHKYPDSYTLNSRFHQPPVFMADQLTNLPIQKSLISDTQALAEELDISWSRLLTLALSDFIRRYRGRKQLMSQIDAAYADAPDDDEVELQRGMRATQRRLLIGR